MTPAQALLDVLPDFGKPALTFAPEPTNGQPFQSFDTRKEHAATVEHETGQNDRMIAEEQIRQELQREHQTALEAERERHAAELEQLQLRLGGEMSEALQDGLRAMEDRVCELTTSAAARILSLILSEELQKRSVEALDHVIRETLNDEDAARINVSGPPLLLQALRESLGEKAGQLDFNEASRPDLSVTIDDRLVETRLSEWAKVLAEVMQ